MSVEAEADSGEGCLLGSSVIFSLYPLTVKRDSWPIGLLLQGRSLIPFKKAPDSPLITSLK